MSVTPAQLDAHLKSLKGKYNYWNGIPGAQCMVIFASVNKFLGGPAYAAPGAKDLWNNPALAGAYVQLPASNPPALGDIGIYDASWGAGWGHITVAVENLDANNYRGLDQNPGITTTRTIAKNGLLGWLRPRALAAAAPAPAPAPAGVQATRTVTQAPVAWVRTAPRADAPPAPGFESGLAHGGVLAVKGYVAGQDPFGTGDNAWYVTRSGFYVWANAAQNTLEGLPKL